MRTKMFAFSAALAVLLTAAQFGCGAKIVEGKKSARRLALQVVTDKTSSGSESILPAESAKIRQGIDDLDPVSVSVVRFGEENLSIWDTPDVSFDMPVPVSVAEFNEEAAEKELSESCRARKTCRDSKIDEMRKAHDDAVQQQEANYQKVRGEKLSLITETIVRAPSRAAVCTDLYGTRDRIAMDAYPRIILITDGQHTCNNQSPAKTFPNSTKVLILLTPIKGESAGNDFDKRRIFVEKLFPGQNVKLIPIVSATGGKIAEALR